MKNELRNLRSQFGGRASSVQTRDANAKRQESSIETGFIYTSRLVFTQEGRRIEIWVNQELAHVSILGDFDVQFFTVHSKDRNGFASSSIGKIRIGPFDYEVFTKDGIITMIQNRLLHSVELADLISSHPFRKGEALHFYRNGLVLYARTEDLSSVLVHRMVALAAIIPEEKDTDLKLPAEFADLVDILKDWGISDDQDRADKIEDTSEADLRQFLAIVEPRLEAINSYLSDLGQNSSNDTGANLGSLLEAAIEAKAALERVAED